MAQISSVIVGKAKDHVKGAMDEADSIRRRHLDRCKTWLQHYLFAREVAKDRHKWRAQVRVPVAYTTVETELPRLLQGIFAHTKWVVAEPREQSDEENAKLVTELLDWQLNTRIDAMTLAEDHFRDCLIYGTGICQIPWRRKVKKVRRPFKLDMRTRYQLQMIGYDLSNLPEYIEQEVLEFDGPMIEPVSLMEVWLDPKGSPGNYAYIVKHDQVTDEDLLHDERLGIYHDVKRILRDRHAGLDNEFDRSGVSDIADVQEIRQLDDTESQDEISGRNDIYEYWGPFDIHGNKEAVECVITVLGDNVIRLERNPYYHGKKPFIVNHYTRQSGSVYGIGKIQPIESLIESLNTVRNQRLDNVSLVLNSMWKMRVSAEVNPLDLISRPGGYIPVNNMDDVDPVTFPDVRASGYQEEEIIRENLDMTSGHYDYTRGSMEGVTKTATGIMTIVKEANVRFDSKIRGFQRSWVIPVAKHCIALNQQFMTEETVVRLQGESGYTWATVNPDNIQGEYDFKPAGTYRAANPETKRMMLLELTTVLLTNPQLAQFVNAYELAQLIRDSYELPAVEKIIVEPIEIEKDEARETLINAARQHAAEILGKAGMGEAEINSILAQTDLEQLEADEDTGLENGDQEDQEVDAA